MKEKLIIIYDFDGTLTPSPVPRYEIIQKCGYDQNKLMERVSYYMNTENLTSYMAYFKSIDMMIEEAKIEKSIDSLCIGAEKIDFNKGLNDYFEYLEDKDVEHYIVTSGYTEYIKKTKISKFIKDVYGTELTVENGHFKLLKAMSEKDKENAIISIKSKENIDYNRIIYIGDGTTDMDAFKFLHDNGGTSIYVNTGEEKLISEKHEFIDYYFLADYGKNSELSNYINSRIEN